MHFSILATYVATVVQDEVLGALAVVCVVDLNGLSVVHVNVDATNPGCGVGPGRCSGCVVRGLYVSDRVALSVDGLTVEGELNTLVSTSTGDGRGSDCDS